MRSLDISTEVAEDDVDVDVAFVDPHVAFRRHDAAPVSMLAQAQWTAVQAKFRRADLSAFKAEPDAFLSSVIVPLSTKC
jgi:hypothetical protein